jgi:hypothetical protein
MSAQATPELKRADARAPEELRFGRIEDAAQVFDEMPIRTVLKDARVLLLDDTSRMQDVVGAGAEQKRRIGGAIKRGGPAGSYASVPAVSQRHTRVRSGGLAVSKETLRFAEDWHSEPIRLCRLVPGVHDTQQFLFLVDRRGRPQVTAGITLRPSPTHGNPSRQTPSSSTESRHRRAHLIIDSVHCGNSLSAHSSSTLKLPQGLP